MILFNGCFDFSFDKIKLRICEKDKKIISINYIKKIAFEYEEIPYTIKRCKKQIMEYLNGDRKAFSIDYQLHGTEFQLQVWKEIAKIEYGKKVSYKYIAKKVHKEKAYRAVANACGQNPIPIIIPCHRIIKNNGKLGGYSGGIDTKLLLLKIELKHY